VLFGTRILMRLFKSFTKSSKRRGATVAETAVVLPVFFVMLFGFIEFGHVFMTIHTLNSAARRAARLGVSEGATSADVDTLAKQVVGSAIRVSAATVLIKDASIFDTADLDASTVDYASLPNVELSTAERRQLFLVRVSVDYADVAILGPRWLGHLQVYGQAVMRRE
jgi:Flp pilus assembly protein TadG